MNVFKESFRILKPLIFICWIVALFRLILEANTKDDLVSAMMSVYTTVFVLFLHSAFTGSLDRLVGLKLFAGALLIGVTCFFVPNTIAYTTAQFAGWDHGRFHVDPEFNAEQQPLLDQGMGYWESGDIVEKKLGRSSKSRAPAIAPTTIGKFKAALTVGFFTTIAGTMASLVLGLLLVWLPAKLRSR